MNKICILAPSSNPDYIVSETKYLSNFFKIKNIKTMSETERFTISLNNLWICF